MPGGLTLLAPIGVAALAAVVVIVLIHMRRRTPPAIAIPSLRFWEPVREDSSDKRRLRKPPITLPFVLQVLVALLAAFALARPALDALPGMASQRTSPQHSIVILDGSTSMLASAGEGDTTTRWEVARGEVQDVLDDWQAGDVVSVIVIGSRTESSSASTRQQVDRLGERIRSLPAPGGIADIDGALDLAADLVLPDRSNRVVLVTDGAVTASAEIAAAVPAPIQLRLVGQSVEAQQNVAVTAIGSRLVTNREDTHRLSFALSSYAPETVRLPYRVQADGVDIVASEIDLAAGETRPIEVTLPQGAQRANVVIEVVDAFAADNRSTLLLGGGSSTALDVLLLSDEPGPLERAIAALPGARIEVYPTTTPGIRALAAGFDLVVFEGVSPLPDDVPDAPMLFIRPPQLGDRFATSGVLSAPVIDRLEAGSAILDGVDLAGVTFGDTPAYVLAPGEEELVRGAANGLTGPLVWRGELDGTPYVVFGFDLQSSNITKRVAFPVLVARSVAALTVPPVASNLALGEALLYRTSVGAETVVVTDPAGKATTLPVPDDAGAVVFQGTGQAGIYTVAELDAGGQVRSEAAFVVNAGHPAESDLRPNAGLANSLIGGEPANEAIADREGLADLWPLLVAIGAALVALEWIVYRAGWMRIRWPRRLAAGTGGPA